MPISEVQWASTPGFPAEPSCCTRWSQPPRFHARPPGSTRIPLQTNQTTCPFSKPQVVYAFETLFRWNREKITLYDDNTFSVAPLAEAEK